MSPTTDDPRNYIAIKPVPEWKAVEDSRLKARDLQNYTLDKPSREEVFKSNYVRRTRQMSAQGHNTSPGKPYEEVGKPLYLSPKAMLQGALGQKAGVNGNIYQQHERKRDPSTDRREEGGRFRSKSARTRQEASETVKPKSTRPVSAVSFLMKNRQRQDLQNIVKDLSFLRENLTKVKMGHALFSMLKTESNHRHIAFLVDKQNDLRSSKEGMRIQSVADEAENRDRHASSASFKQMTLKRASSRASIASATSGISATSAMVARKAEVMKTLAERARPYTPVHSNISHPVETTKVHLRIWRQLCALHWLLQACQLEMKSEIQRHHKVMTPISKCWDLIEPGGKTRDMRVVLEEKKNNTKWTKFTRSSTHKAGLNRNRNRRKNTGYHVPSLRRSGSIASDLGGMKRVASYASDLAGLKKNPSIANDLSTYRDESSARKRRPSGMSVVPSVEVDETDGELSGAKPSRPSSPGQSSVTTTIVGGTTAGSEYGDEDSNATDVGHLIIESDKKNDHEDWFVEKDCHQHLKKLLSTVKQSVVGEMQRRDRTAQFVAKTNKTLPISVYEWSRTSYFKIGKEDVNISRIVIPAVTPVTDFGDSKPMKKVVTTKIRPHTAAVGRRRDSTQTPINEVPTSGRPSTAAPQPAKLKRPMSSPAKLVTHFNFKFSSAEKEKHLDEIKEKFEEVGDAKALQLHNQLIELEKKRQQRMEIKFETLSKTGNMHRALKGMRKAAHSQLMSEKLAKKKRSCLLPSDWYSTLMQNLPEDVHADENCNKILQKLGMMGIEMMEDTKRITPEAFLCALRTLRPWELCSPDVSSAIEFVRDVVVQMSPEEFDEWRQSKINHKEVLVGSDSKSKK